MRIPSLLAAVLLALFIVVGLACGPRSAIAAVAQPAAETTKPPPLATPDDSQDVKALQKERDRLSGLLASVETQLGNAKEEARQHQLDVLATWLTWIGVLAIVAGIVLGVIGYGLRGIGALCGSAGLGVLAFARSLAEYGHLLKYAGAVGAVGIIAWIAWTHRRAAVAAKQSAEQAEASTSAADATIKAIEALKVHVDRVLGPDERKKLLASIVGGAEDYIDARRIDLGLKKAA